MNDVLKKLQEIKESNPRLKEKLENYIGVLSEFLKIESTFYSFYAESFIKKFTLLKTAFEISFIGSINQKELIRLEKKAINKILKNGKKLNSLTITNYNSLIDLNSDLTEVYKKLIQGTELEHLETILKDRNEKALNDLTTVKALCLFQDYLDVCMLNLNPEPIEETMQEPRKYKSEHHALAYIFDCNSIGESIPYGSKKELESIGKKRIEGTISGNTFYKAVTRILNEYKDLNSENTLEKIAGEDWKQILFELTKYPEELKEYLQSKQL